MTSNPIRRAGLPAIAAVLALISFTAMAKTASVKEDTLQYRADRAALQAQLKLLGADEARFKSDMASGRMSAESKDAYEVYLDKQAVKGEERDIASDRKASLQMKADKQDLGRQIKRLELAENRLKTDTMEGKMAAESPDAERVYQDRLAVHAEERQIASDKTTLRADEKK